MLQIHDLGSYDSEQHLEAQMKYLLDCTDTLSVGDDCEIIFEGDADSGAALILRGIYDDNSFLVLAKDVSRVSKSVFFSILDDAEILNKVFSQEVVDRLIFLRGRTIV